MLATNNLILGGLSIINFAVHPTTLDVASPNDGQLWFRTDTGRMRSYDGTTTQTVAWLSDVTGGAITGALWDAQSVVVAIVDDTPVVQVVADSEFVGRAAGGNIGVVTVPQAKTMLAYTASDVTNVPAGNVAATNLQAAINELDTEKLDASSFVAATVGAGNVAVALTVGTSTDYARQDHNHLLADNVVVTAKIADSNVTLAKIADIGDDTILGNVAGASAAPVALTPTQIRTMINVEDASAADQIASEVPFTPTGTITSTNVQAAIAEVDGEIATQIAALVGASPATLDTLQELGDALGDDPNYAATTAALIATKTGKYAIDIGDGATTVFTITHSLNSLDVVSQVRASATGEVVIADIANATVNTCTVTFAVAPTAGQYRIVVIG